VNFMFSFTKNQKIYQLDSINIGGQPGHYPTVLFGGLFFKGIPDFKLAKEQLNVFYKMSKQTGVPGIPDFFIRKKENIEPILTFIETKLPPNLPFSIDISDPDVKIEVLRELSDRGLLKNTVYNSIHIGVTKEEIKGLTEHPPNAVILVAFNPKDKSPDGKVEVLENGAHLLDKGLIALAQDIGIDNIFIDTAALAPGDISGAAIAAIPVIKEEYGFPTGCAIHNVVEKTTWLKQFPNQKPCIDIASNVNITTFGGDFAIFGPMHHAETIFPLIAWQDMLVSEYTEGYFGISPSENHPRRIIG